jgi:hypothetical protein
VNKSVERGTNNIRMQEGSQRLANCAIVTGTILSAKGTKTRLTHQAGRRHLQVAGRRTRGRHDSGWRREVGKPGHTRIIGVGGHVARAGVGRKGRQESGPSGDGARA